MPFDSFDWRVIGVIINFLSVESHELKKSTSVY